jgi:hypothetical protein
LPTSRRIPSAREARSCRDSCVPAGRARRSASARRNALRRVLRAGAGLALTLAICVGLNRPAHAGAAPDPNATKADMLWNIAKFVQWPEASLLQSHGQIIFTILGEDDLAAELANLLSTKTINGKPVFVRFARRAQDAQGSQILYVAASEVVHIDAVLAEVGESPVLTVADSPAFAAHGGMVGFATESDHVRFEINLGHAERSGLRISAKLLALARVVDSGP